jgi:hypothetical protein
LDLEAWLLGQQAAKALQASDLALAGRLRVLINWFRISRTYLFSHFFEPSTRFKNHQGLLNLILKKQNSLYLTY